MSEGRSIEAMTKIKWPRPGPQDNALYLERLRRMACNGKGFSSATCPGMLPEGSMHSRQLNLPVAEIVEHHPAAWGHPVRVLTKSSCRPGQTLRSAGDSWESIRGGVDQR